MPVGTRGPDGVRGSRQGAHISTVAGRKGQQRLIGVTLLQPFDGCEHVKTGSPSAYEVCTSGWFRFLRDFKRQYNESRPHSARRWISPAQCARRCWLGASNGESRGAGSPYVWVLLIRM